LPDDSHTFRIMDRVIDLVLTAQAGPLPSNIELAKRYECHPRTISRLLACIERRMPVQRRAA
jgi:DNA-binding transcriptional regulator YhcF (GntR family)